ncbi:MAG: hypothetical protein MUF18_09530 [Fimbriiglobus sp.]|nr:hypothetical protein [Fimbriiglobus sp.]
MLRLLLATLVSVVVASTTSAQIVYIQSGPVVVSPQPPVMVSRPQPQPPLQPAIGMAGVNSPFWFGTDFSIGGPGYQFRGYPPYNGWSSGYRGAYYGTPVPPNFTPRRRW